MTKFRHRKNGGAWTETDQALPYVLPGVGATDSPDVQGLGEIVSLTGTAVITSNGGGASATIALAENTSYVTTVTVAGSGSGVVYSISGPDAALFTINSATGALTFASPPDFETPLGARGNGYDVIVRATAGATFDEQSLSINLTPVNDNLPVITSNGGGGTAAIAVVEGNTAVAVVTASDADLDLLSFSIVPGADAIRFVINASGVLSFVTAPAVASPTDVGANNVYDVIVRVSDGTFTDDQAIAVTVTTAAAAYTVVSAPAGYTISFVSGDTWRVNVSSGSYAAGSPYSFSKTALDAAGLLLLATLPVTGTDTAGNLQTSQDPLVIGLDAAGAILMTREWLQGGVPTGDTALTRTVTSSDVSLGLSIRWRAQNDLALVEATGAAVSAAAFGPNDLTELENWVDASDVASLTLTGVRIDGVADKSTKGRNWGVSGTVGNRPTLTGEAMVFAGTAGMALLNTSFYTPADSFSQFFLIKVDPTSVARGTLLGGNGTGTGGTEAFETLAWVNANRFAGVLTNSAGAGAMSTFDSAGTGAVNVANGAWCVVEVVHTSTLHQVYVNGTLNFTRNLTLAGTYAVPLIGLFGRRPSSGTSTNNSKGSLNQFIHLSTTDATKRTQVRSYLATKRDALISAGA